MTRTPAHQAAIAGGLAHFAGLPRIELDGDRAVVTSYLQILTPHPTAAPHEVPNHGVSKGFRIHRVAANRWELERTAAGLEDQAPHRAHHRRLGAAPRNPARRAAIVRERAAEAHSRRLHRATAESLAPPPRACRFLSGVTIFFTSATTPNGSSVLVRQSALASVLASILDSSSGFLAGALGRARSAVNRLERLVSALAQARTAPAAAGRKRVETWERAPPRSA